jgi:hypothetical protein
MLRSYKGKRTRSEAGKTQTQSDSDQAYVAAGL